MRIAEIENFFRQLDSRIDFKLEVILTGGAASIVMGVERATNDIDFEIQLKIPSGKHRQEVWEDLTRELQAVAQSTNISPQFSEDIDRWSSIAMPFKKSTLWLKLSHITIRLLDPALWAIGKLARSLTTDRSDIVNVLKQNKSAPKTLARTWGKALGCSPGGQAQPVFKRSVEIFFRNHAQEIWGRKVKPEELIELFLKTARSTTRAS